MASAKEKAPAATAEFGVTQVDVAVEIEAPPRRVWKALVEETSAWWHKDFYTGPRPKGFVIEAKLGGRAYEDWGAGAGLVWYTVTGVDPGRSLTMSGNLFAAWGGPSTMMIQVTLEDGGGKRTVLKLSETTFGRANGKLGPELKDGWKVLFEALREFVERSR